MARNGVVEASLRLDAKQWEQGIRDATGDVVGLVQATKGMADDIKAAIDEVGTSFALGLGGAFAGASASLALVTIWLKGAGDQALELKKNLSGAFDGADLDRVAEKVGEIAGLELQGLDTDELVEGAKRLGTFSDDVTGDLERVANVAAKTGETFGSLKDYFAEFTVNPDAQNSLMEIADITPAKLAAFGATLDATGTRILTTGNYAKSAQAALRAVADAEYGGAMLQMASGTDKFNQQLGLLSQEAGEVVAVLSDEVAGALAPTVESLRNFASSAVPAIGAATALGAAFFGIGAGAVGVVMAKNAWTSMILVLKGGRAAWALARAGISATNIATMAWRGSLMTTAAAQTATAAASGGLAASTTALTGALTASATSVAIIAAGMALLAVTVAAVGYTFVKLTKDIEYQTAAEEQLLAIEQKRAQWAKTAGGLLGKTTEELREQGTTSKEAAQALLGLQERMEAARNAGNTALAESLQRQIVELKARKEELAQLESDQRKTEAITDPLGFSRPKTLDQENERIAYLRAQGQITEREELAMRKRALEAHQADEKEKRALAIETAKFETQEREKAGAEEQKRRDESFAAEMDRIKLELTEKKISQQEALAQEEEALKRFARSDGEKRALVQRRAKQSAEDQKQAEDKLEKSRADKVSDRLDAIQLMRTEEKISAAEQIIKLNDVLAHYKLTEDEKTKVRQKRADVEKSIREKEAADEKKRADDAKKLAEKNAEDLAKAREKQRDLQESAVEDRIDSLQDRTALTGSGNSVELKKLLDEQQAIKEAQIKAEGEKLAEATKSAEARAQIEKNVNEQIRQQIAETADAYSDALGDQKDAIEKYSDALQKESRYTGKDNGSKIKQALQEQLNLEAEMIRVEGDKAKAAATSAAERAAIETRVQQQIRAEQLETAEAYKAALDEQAKALENHKKRERGESTFQGAFGIADLNESIKQTMATTTRSKRGPSLATFAALPGALNPQRADVIANGGSAKSIGAEVGSAVAAAIKSKSEQKVLVDVKVSDDRVKSSVSQTTSVNGRMGDVEKAGRGQRSGPRVR